MATLAARVELVRGLGWQHEELIDAAEVRRLLPAVAPHVCGGLLVRGDGSADPMRHGDGVSRRRRCSRRGVARGHSRDRHRAARRRLVVSTDHGDSPPIGGELRGRLGSGVRAHARRRYPVRSSAADDDRDRTDAAVIEPTVGATSRPLSFKQTDAGTVLIGGGMLGRVDVAAEWGIVNFHNLANRRGLLPTCFR